MRIGRLVTITVTAAALTIPAVTTAAPAQAAGQVCEAGGGGLCLNNWSGSGAVKMGQNGWSNQSFGLAALTTACGGGRVTHTCPFTVGTGLNDAFFDDFIATMEYNPTRQCIGTTSSSRAAILTTCPDTAGHGGGLGTILVERQNVNNCFSQNGDTQLANVHWSSQDVTYTGLTGSTATGNPAAMFSNVNFNVACWGTG